MSTNSITKQKGFTIIEVVLVLAIAGLIFLIVFLALPQLQKSRRDTQRKNDVGRVLSALENYSSNNSGDYPSGTQAAVDAFKTAYINKINDPSTGSTYALTLKTTTSAAPTTLGEMDYAVSATCNNGGLTIGSGNNRQIAITVTLENGSAYCQQNS
jgi:prepilin-type N-terminal cleavage/methylation domain-containing protein